MLLLLYILSHGIFVSNPDSIPAFQEQLPVEQKLNEKQTVEMYDDISPYEVRFDNYKEKLQEFVSSNENVNIHYLSIKEITKDLHTEYIISKDAIKIHDVINSSEEFASIDDLSKKFNVLKKVEKIYKNNILIKEVHHIYGDGYKLTKIKHHVDKEEKEYPELIDFPVAFRL